MLLRRLVTLYTAGWMGFCLAVAAPAFGQKFRPDDPIWHDPDQIPVPRPEVIDDVSQIVDFLTNTFTRRRGENVPRAMNINTWGETPDSSWYTNRASLGRVNLESLAADRGPGPDMSRPWVIISAKSQGITPGFTIRDACGEVYFIKFDPPGYAQLATSTEAICTLFFHAFGYHVPENHLVRIARDRVVVGAEAKIKDESGVRRFMDDKDVDRIFEKVDVGADGTVQVIASLKLEGEVVGPFKYYGTRPDDPNDIFPHEHRRELRGLRLFAAWLNHDDSRSINTKDFYVRQGELGFVKHHLIDFGSCLGSGSVRIQSRRAGNEYMFEWRPIVKAALTLGLWDRPWRYIRYPDYPAVGRFEGEAFRPELWRPEYPNPAFERMDPEDAFWACRTIARFTDDIVRKLVRVGALRDPEAEEYLVRSLIKRRDKILAHYLALVNPLVDFKVANRSGHLWLTFDNLGEELGLGKGDSYEYRWFAFDNEQQIATSIGPVEVVGVPELLIPRHSGEYLKVEIATLARGQDGWRRPVQVFLTGPSRRIVGIER